MMITLIKPLLIAFVQTSAVKNLIVDLLAVAAARTDNKVDDQAVKLIKEKLLNEKATEEKFNELHNLVTLEFLKRVKSGEASAHELKAACDWLKTNDVTGVAYEGSPLDKLNKIMPKVDPELVKTRLYGKQKY